MCEIELIIILVFMQISNHMIIREISVCGAYCIPAINNKKPNSTKLEQRLKCLFILSLKVLLQNHYHMKKSSRLQPYNIGKYDKVFQAIN